MHLKSNKHKRNNFSIIELLVVISIMAIMAGLGLQAVKTNPVNAAAQLVGGKLRLARDHAISTRSYIAVLFPSTNPTGLNDYKSASVMIAKVTKGLSYISYVKGTEWEFFPSASALNSTTTGLIDISSVPFPSKTDSTATIPAVIFKPSGALSNVNAVSLEVIHGSFKSGTLQLNNAGNKIKITVNKFTGKIRYQ